jgi:hypothetical protein
MEERWCSAGRQRLQHPAKKQVGGGLRATCCPLLPIKMSLLGPSITSTKADMARRAARFAEPLAPRATTRPAVPRVPHPDAPAQLKGDVKQKLLEVVKARLEAGDEISPYQLTLLGSYGMSLADFSVGKAARRGAAGDAGDAGASSGTAAKRRRRAREEAGAVGAAEDAGGSSGGGAGESVPAVARSSAKASKKSYAAAAAAAAVAAGPAALPSASKSAVAAVAVAAAAPAAPAAISRAAAAAAATAAAAVAPAASSRAPKPAATEAAAASPVSGGIGSLKKLVRSLEKLKARQAEGGVLSRPEQQALASLPAAYSGLLARLASPQ